jgi:hypothetical protein
MIRFNRYVAGPMISTPENNIGFTRSFFLVSRIKLTCGLEQICDTVFKAPSALLTTILSVHHPCTVLFLVNLILFTGSQKNSVASVRKRTIPTERPPFVSEISANVFVDRGCHVVSVTYPYGHILGFLDRSRYYIFQVAPQLCSRG